MHKFSRGWQLMERSRRQTNNNASKIEVSAAATNHPLVDNFLPETMDIQDGSLSDLPTFLGIDVTWLESELTVEPNLILSHNNVAQPSTSDYQIATKSGTAADILETLSRGDIFEMPDEDTDLPVEQLLDSEIFNGSVTEYLFAKLDSLGRDTDYESTDHGERPDPSHMPSDEPLDTELTGSLNADTDHGERPDPNHMPSDEPFDTELTESLDADPAHHLLIQAGDDQASAPQQPKKRLKKAWPDSWKQNNNKSKREKGQSYHGSKKVYGISQKVVKEGKKIKPRCQCTRTKTLRCGEFSEEDRQSIFNNVWKDMRWGERKVYVQALVDTVPTRCNRTNTEQSRKKTAFRYHLKINGIPTLVCKRMFLSTTGFGRWSVNNWVMGQTTPVARVQSNHYARSLADREFMKTEIFDKLPKMPSHYCRASTSKVYLEPTIPTIACLHKLYKEKCTEHNKPRLSRQVLIDECGKINLSVFKPRKDQCDVCVGHEVGHVTDEDWTRHRAKKDEARDEKTRDKQHAIQCQQPQYVVKKTLVACMDVQAVLLVPSLQASAIYYKQKLCVHNYTLYNLATHEAICYVWHENEGRLTASEFASCLEDNLEYDNFILYSDGCGYQNRNVVLSNALLQFCKEHNKTITQKILEKGHTQMEVDSVHAKVEAKLRQKKKAIYVPADYVGIIKGLRVHPEPYKVKHLDHGFFKDFSCVGPLKSFRPRSRVGDTTVSDIRAMQYSQDGTIMYKLRHLSDWAPMPEPRRPRAETPSHPTPLFDNSRRIVESKWKNFQELKSVIPVDYHTFYDNLCH